jgi:hypothetical protein
MRVPLCRLGLGFLTVLSLGAVPALRPMVDPVCGAPRLALSAADPDLAFELRAGDDLDDPARWETLMRLAPGTHERVWFDPEVSKLGRRFYRLESRIPELPPVAENFALLDQTGKRHDFQREGDARAVVLVFTDNSHLADTWQAVRPLQERFGPAGVRFWLVNPRDSRAAIASAATGINVPVLHDVAQLVTRTFGARAVQDVVALNRGFAETFYTGALATPCLEPGGTNWPPRWNNSSPANRWRWNT